MSNFFLTFTDFWFKTQKSTITKTEIDGKQFIKICFYSDSVEAENLHHVFNLDKATAIRFLHKSFHSLYIALFGRVLHVLALAFHLMNKN